MIQIKINFPFTQEDLWFIEKLRDSQAPTSVLPWEWEDLRLEEEIRANLEVPSWIYLQH